MKGWRIRLTFVLAVVVVGALLAAAGCCCCWAGTHVPSASCTCTHMRAGGMSSHSNSHRTNYTIHGVHN